jgi:arylsulfatase A-like enzyme
VTSDQSDAAILVPSPAHSGSANAQNAAPIRTFASRLVDYFRNPLGPESLPVLARAISLFLILVAIKSLQLVSLERHLHEAHFRPTLGPFTWLNYAAFGVFLLVGFLVMIRLGEHCRGISLKAVRSANAAVLLFGLLFAFLNFEVMGKNYIYPVMTGVLRWSDVIWYLSMDFFFRPPYLAAWLFAYGACYYVIERRGQGGYGLHVTAVFSVLYSILNLREMIADRRELLVCVLVGLFCLTTKRESRALRWSWLPLIGIIATWVLMLSDAREGTRISPYFMIYASYVSVLFFAATLWSARQGFFTSWRHVLPFLFTAFLLLANCWYPGRDNYSNLLFLGYAVPRYFLGEFLMFAFIWGLGAISSSRRWRVGLDAMIVCFIALALIDLRLTQIMTVRLDWDLISFSASPVMAWRLAKPYLPLLAAGVVLIGCIYGLLAGGASRVLSRHRSTDCPSANGSRLRCFFAQSSVGGLAFLLVGLACLGVFLANPDKALHSSTIVLARSLPIWRHVALNVMSPQEFAETTKSLGMERLGQPTGAHSRGKTNVNIVLVYLESTFNKHLSLFGSPDNTQPLLSAYTNRMEIFPNFYTCFAGSIHARLATFTSLYPVSDFNEFTLRRVPVKSLWEAMADEGYNCSMFYSCYYDYTNFRDFLRNRGIKEMYDAHTMPGVSPDVPRVSWGLKEEYTVPAIKQKLREYAKSKERFFLTYIPSAPHQPFDQIPDRFKKFRNGAMNDFTPLYKNCLLFMDWAVTSIVDELRDNGLLENTLVVITADHGEMLGENNGPIGHGWAVTPELSNIPLIIIDPRSPGYKINYTIGAQVDLLPTILDLVAIDLPHDHLYQGVSLYSTQAQQPRQLLLNSYQEWAMIVGNQMFLGDRTGNAGVRSAVTITNEGSRTLHLPLAVESAQLPSISALTEFQANLLRNYDEYRQPAYRNAKAVVIAGGNSQISDH